MTEKTDERESEFIKQRLKRGFDDSETWSLCNTIVDFIVSRLERFQEIVKDVNEPDEVFGGFEINSERGAWNFNNEE